ncbi:uncharacterized protein SRS1_15510 [Sporisorium reilianum f. sp. reilianum]|uniref:Uncharacterized protein n=1 Tax=Sporisorium reilianum f. sp. reilianum TaxID=72559 RepID=A0A2N8UIA2_9BASI|nr:uncharacterized protein SRS1_15510 [Sporisorium reilianum f. sp. reilianum]
MYHPYPPDPTSAEAGPSRPRLEPAEQPDKPKKRRRLQFSSELRTNIQRYNPDGTETVEYLHQQSTQRLKRKWDSIFERFKDAHLQEQDEIYLGNRANGEPIVMVKDRGSLRSLRQSMEFGVFIKDEELQGWKERPEAQMQEQDDEEDDNFDPSRMPSHRAQLTGASSSESEAEEEDPAANDPDLREFLQAEARRKAMLGKSGDEDSEPEEEDDDVIDFADPTWNTYQPSATVIAQPAKKAPTTAKRPNLPAAPSQPEIDAPDLVLSSSEDDDDTDVVTVHSDSDEELIDSIRTKRQNIEELLQCTTPFETLPYNDIFGLADLLKLTDNTSRLYVDLVSDDEEEAAPAQEHEPAVGNVGRGDVIDLTNSSLPHSSLSHSSLPNSSLIADPASSPLSELTSSRASSVAPVAPASDRSALPQEATFTAPPVLLPSTPVQPAPVEETPAEAMAAEGERIQAGMGEAPGPVEAHSPAEAEETPVALTFKPRERTPATPPPPGPPSVLQSRNPSQPEPVPAVLLTAVIEAPLSEPSTPAPPSPPVVSATPAQDAAVASSHADSHHQKQPPQPTPSRPSSQKLNLPLSAEHRRASATSTSSTTPLSSTRRHVSTPTSLTKHFASSAERRLQQRQERRASRSKPSSGGERRAACGGPTKCTKTFCLHCASLSR